MSYCRISGRTWKNKARLKLNVNKYLMLKHENIWLIFRSALKNKVIQCLKEVKKNIKISLQFKLRTIKENVINYIMVTTLVLFLSVFTFVTQDSGLLI